GDFEAALDDLSGGWIGVRQNDRDSRSEHRDLHRDNEGSHGSDQSFRRIARAAGDFRGGESKHSRQQTAAPVHVRFSMGTRRQRVILKNRQQILTIAAVAAVAIFAMDKLVLTPLGNAWTDRNKRIK